MTKHKSDITVVPNLDRLQEMANFLKKLEPEKFNFDLVISKYRPEGTAICGTKCCAIGWMPAIWPELFMWFNSVNKDLGPEFIYIRRRDDPDGNRSECVNFSLAKAFLGLNSQQCDNFFMPGINRTHSCDTPITPIELASQIEAFIAEHSPKEQIINA